MAEINVAQWHSSRYAPRRWGQLLQPTGEIDGDIEFPWLEQALAGQATAALWTGRAGLVAPLSYHRHASLTEVCEASAQRGWPVRMRRSGGGVVPQGPGILNLSLAYPCPVLPGAACESVYQHLCGVLGDALAKLGITSNAQSVKGSFCDGRFNLASVVAGKARKIAGTAQYWRRGVSHHAVLAHSLLLVDADPTILCLEANRFEADLGSNRRYESSALTSVAQAWLGAHPGEALPEHFSRTVTQHIAASLIQ